MADTDRKELVNEITALAERALTIREPEAASVLYSLAGALCALSERELMEVVCEHARRDIERISGVRAVDEWPEQIG